MVHRAGSARVRVHRQGDRPLEPQGRPLRRSAVVVAHRPSAALTRALRSVASEVDEVLVVDNGSPGASVREVAEQAGARVLRCARNLGYAGGASAGVAATAGELVALLNDDARAEAGLFDAAEAALAADPGLAAVGPTVLLAGRFLEVVLDDETWFAPGDARPLGRRVVSVALDGEELLERCLGDGLHRLEQAGVGAPGAERWRWSAGRVPFYVPVPEGDAPGRLEVNGVETAWRREVELVNSLGLYLRPDGYGGDVGAERPLAEGDRPSVVERFGISGVALVVRREAWRRVGPLEASYFAYYEDLDWCWRARLAGWRLAEVPGGLVRHERGATSGGLRSARVRFLAERNRLRTLARNGPLRVALREALAKARGKGDDGVAEVVPGTLARSLAERLSLRRRWALAPEEVFDRWAGVDAPGVGEGLGAGEERSGTPTAGA